MNKTVTIIVGVVAFLIVGAGAFWGGTAYEKAQAANAAEDRRVQMLGAAAGRQVDQRDARAQQDFGQSLGQAAFSNLTGTIERIDGNVLILSSDQGPVRVQATDATQVQKLADISLDGLQVGEEVTVSGSPDEDGSITARTIRSGTLSMLTRGPGLGGQ